MPRVRPVTVIAPLVREIVPADVVAVNVYAASKLVIDVVKPPLVDVAADSAGVRPV